MKELERTNEDLHQEIAKRDKGIDGEHYYVTTAQWNYILKTYGGGGVPLYVVFDKEGKKVAAYTGYPGNEKMKETIVSNL